MIVVAVIYGVAAVLIFRRFTDRAAIRKSVNRILAHVMELGLFLDSPALVFGAQRDLLRENWRLLRLVMLPSAMLMALFAIIYAPMNAIYGHGPLPVGETSVVTVQMSGAPMPPVRLEVPDGMVVETPAVRIVHDQQISWRVRPLQESFGDLKFHVDDRVVTAGYFMRDPAIRSIEIRYPKVAWLLWFAAISSGSAVACGLIWKR
ncbi:MAG TPA: hypothetical protein VK752_24420 [Bryobacteraceae bacterium]|jgi:hypothetical protein|nr:hypothetical protein [Bryobacteraceae bacterium]